MKKAKTIAPCTPPPRLTSVDLFGEDSDNEQKPSTSTKPGNIPPLISNIMRRESNGFSKQINERAEGKYYVDVKIYNADEIKNISPISRWRYAITSIKTKLDENKESWRFLKEFVKHARTDFKNCPISLIGAYGSMP